MNRRQPGHGARLICAVLAFGTASVALAQSAANYPSRPVRIIVAYPPGGGTTPVARSLADKLSKDLGQNFIIDNRPGGNTIIGTQLLARSQPDGYTLQMVTNTHVINRWTQTNLPYDTVKDFAPVSTMSRNNHMLAAHASMPGTLKELIAHVRKSGDSINAAVTGVGSVNHLSTLRFMQLIGAKFTVVAYKGGGVAITDLLAATMHFSINSIPGFLPHVKAGKLKGVAVSGERRQASLPDVPTFAEAGMKDFSAANWYSLLAPARTPRPIIEKLHEHVRRWQSDAEVVAVLAKLGVEPFPNSLPETEAFIRADMERVGKVIKEHNIKVEAD